jgi:hypothetical protein
VASHTAELFDEGQLQGDDPIQWDNTPVTLRSEALHSMWWRGRQWAVTAYGIEALDGTYTIEARRLTDDLASHGWTSHMAEKTWVDIPDFMTAWLVALALHGASTTGACKTIMETTIYPPSRLEASSD